MSHRPPFALSLLAVVALVGCTPDSLPNEARDVQWDVPGLTTSFDGEGVLVVPDAGPHWRWELLGIHPEGRDDLLLGEVDLPVSDDDTQSFGRGAVVEHYVRRAGSIEQQFLIDAPLELNGHDLVIDGAIETDGEFGEDTDGWTWANDTGAVRLGDVTVFDANGDRLEAYMEVTADSTRIVVDADALAGAAYPVLIDPVIGPDDFRVSMVGAEGDLAARANNAAVAHDPGTDTFLVVWEGRTDAATDKAIWSRRVDAAGTPLGADAKLSTGGAMLLDAQSASVAFDPTSSTYLVVWSEERVEGEHEIFGQRVNADGTPNGANFRISTVGVDGDTLTDAVDPRVAWNPVASTFYVVFEADVTNGEQRIHGVPVSAAGAVGSQVQISNATALGDDAVDPDLAVGADGTTVVVWRDEAADGREIFGARVSTANVVSGEAQLTFQDGASPATDTRSEKPRIAYNATTNGFVVVLHGRDATSGLAAGETEIYAQSLTSAMVPIGSTVRLTSFGGLGDATNNAADAVVGVTTAGTYVVAFEGGPLGSSETYALETTAILGPLVATSAISSMGDDVAGFDAFDPALAFSTAANAFLVVFEGDDTSPGDEQDEIFAQLFAPDNDAPVADAGGPYTADLGNAIAFVDASSDDDGTVTGWAWDFGDGNTSTQQNPSHVYGTAGSFTVTLTVTDDGNAKNTTTTTATVDGGPVANPTVPPTGLEGSAVSFTGDFTDDGSGHTFLWTFGDGSTSSLQNPTHTYADDGTFAVTFTVTDAGGRPSTGGGNVSVGNVAPVANATIPTSSEEGAMVSFTSTPTDPGTADTFSYAWDFGDGETSSVQNPTHTYRDDGSFLVTLVVTDDDGGVSVTESETVVVDNLDPTANANGPYDSTGAVSFTGTATDPGADDVLSFLWNFGDGNTSTQQNPTHTYSAPGTFTVTLTVSDADGGSDTTSTSATVRAADDLATAVDALTVYANTAYSDLVGGPPVVTPGSRGALRPASIRSNLEEILSGLANGCRTTEDLQGYAGGAYGTPDLTGFHDVADGDVLNGLIDPGRRVLGAEFDGIGLSFGEPGAFSTYNSRGQSFAIRSDGGFVAGRFVRVRGTRGIWYAVHGVCDDTRATAADALDDPWYVGDLP